MSIGPLEILIVILIVVLIWRGPKILPQLGEAVGKTVKGVRDSVDRDSDGGDSTPASSTDDTDRSGQ